MAATEWLKIKQDNWPNHPTSVKIVNKGSVYYLPYGSTSYTSTLHSSVQYINVKQGGSTAHLGIYPKWDLDKSTFNNGDWSSSYVDLSIQYDSTTYSLGRMNNVNSVFLPYGKRSTLKVTITTASSSTYIYRVKKGNTIYTLPYSFQIELPPGEDFLNDFVGALDPLAGLEMLQMFGNYTISNTPFGNTNITVYAPYISVGSTVYTSSKSFNQSGGSYMVWTRRSQNTSVSNHTLNIYCGSRDGEILYYPKSSRGSTINTTTVSNETTFTPSSTINISKEGVSQTPHTISLSKQYFGITLKISGWTSYTYNNTAWRYSTGAYSISIGPNAYISYKKQYLNLNVDGVNWYLQDAKTFSWNAPSSASYTYDEIVGTNTDINIKAWWQYSQGDASAKIINNMPVSIKVEYCNEKVNKGETTLGTSATISANSTKYITLKDRAWFADNHMNVKLVSISFENNYTSSGLWSLQNFEDVSGKGTERSLTS